MKINKLIKIMLIEVSIWVWYGLIVSIVLILINYKCNTNFFQMLSTLSMAYISSFIFYLIVVVYKKIKDKQNYYPTINYLIKCLISRGEGLFSYIYQCSTTNSKYDKDEIYKLSKEEFYEICKTCKPKDIKMKEFMGPLNNLREVSYLAHINNQITWVKNYNERIYKFSYGVDSQCMKLLFRLEQTNIFMLWDKRHIYNTDNNFEWTKKQLYDFLQELKILKKYIKTDIEPYIKKKKTKEVKMENNIKKEIRWVQRFDNFKKAISNLEEGIKLGNEKKLSNLEKQGIIQGFEITYELAWNTVKDFYKFQGETEIQGSRDAFRLAFKRELIEEGDLFMEMIKSRQITSHTYNNDTIEEIYLKITKEYYNAFLKLKIKFDEELKRI